MTRPPHHTRPPRGSPRRRATPSFARTRRRRSSSPRRLIALFVAFVVAFVGMAARLVIVQIVDAPAYARAGRQWREKVVTFPARRGAIFDRNGEPLAVSVDLPTVFADPALVEDVERSARRLARVLGLDAEEVATKLTGTRPGSRFEYIKRQVSPEVAKRVRALELPGIAFQEEAKRLYPNKQLASHVLGFVNGFDQTGASGVELEYENILQGEPGRMALEEDPAGRRLPQASFEFEAPKPGRSLFLALDKELQYFTEVTLAEAVRRYSADAASAIVMRPSTGEILSLASFPSFNPSAPGEAHADAWRNRTVTDVYEPGSAYKIVTASAALEEETVTPRTVFDVPDALPYADRVFNDSHPHATEKMTVAEIIQQSSNVGTIKIALRLGGKKLDEYVRRFGFGASTGLDFPGETKGIVLDRREWSGSTIATIPIGQGIAVTPMQMAAAYATLANGGVRVEPKLLYATMDGRGGVKRSSSATRERVVSEATAQKMVRILEGVVKKGTGVEAQIPGYRVAGKTGTAQKPLPTGGYGNSYVGSFAGFAPAGRPEIVVLVVLDEPSPIWGGATAAPTFRTIAEFALRHLGVPPNGNAERAAREIERSQINQAPTYD